ncbi:primosomal protein N' (replication factor Y) [Runella defluvii]|uniref:Replication restart protein PriA n=1 Tax=Runella defluvii TaxID=370973 RepID=A0A7W5ZL54_9BACT|nr:primosomal protein N' [Runella defluvii]MBB3839061.1 primosomal protein N' (replication factor Y) [Runella defluvii]
MQIAENDDFGSEEITLFADLILPVPVAQLFTYRVPRVINPFIKNGARVVVPFGKNRVVTGVVAKIHQTPPTKYQARYIAELLDDEPLVTPYQIELFHWIADYYLCTVGEVLNVALPSGLKITSQSKIQYNPDFEYYDLLTEEEANLLEEIKKYQSLTYEEVEKRVGATNINHIIKSLIGKRAIILFEEVKEKYKPKVLKKVKLNGRFETRENLMELIAQLDKFPKQQEIIMSYVSQVPIQNVPYSNRAGLEKSFFTQNEAFSDSALSTLIKKGTLEEFEVTVSRFADVAPDFSEGTNIHLTTAQQRAFDEIITQFQSKDTVLLHGVTGSGKTEVYINLAQQVLASGSQVLFLLPEIALTTQIVVRLKKVFGDKLGIYHSKFSDNERVEVWKGVVSGQFQLVVGVRSAIFLPFDSLGLIIVDEEHESSYKQYDPAPRYHARDVAIVAAQRQQAKVLLGSATPALESYYQALNGRYGFVQLLERYGKANLPEFVLIDTKKERKSKKMKFEFSSVLINELQEALNRNEQSIVFQNRRGYSSYLQCEECGWIGECENCAVSLTYHQKDAELRCHYCGHKEKVPKLCPGCSSTKVRTVGFGTEKLEDQLKIFFPTARIARMDLDTTRAKNAYKEMIEDIEQGNVDILVGTQMISKGLDFENVSTVGVFDADRMIHFPDLRSAERAFQLITQVSGRAGRRADRKGRVLIQTGNPSQKILQKIITNDYIGMYEEEIKERENFKYPPFTRLIKLTVKHFDQTTALQSAQKLTQLLLEKMGEDRVLGPQPPLVERIRNRFLFDILIKLEREKVNFRAAKAFILEKVTDILTDKTLKGTDVTIDVDCL